MIPNLKENLKVALLSAFLKLNLITIKYILAILSVIRNFSDLMNILLYDYND